MTVRYEFSEKIVRVWYNKQEKKQEVFYENSSNRRDWLYW